MITFACPVCNTAIRAEDKQAGAKLACPKCRQRLQIPSPASQNKTVLGSLLPTQAAGAATPGVPDRERADWFYQKGPQKHGPVSFAQLQTLAVTGNLGCHDLVWTKGMGVWLPAAKIQGVFPQNKAIEAIRAWLKSQWHRFRALNKRKQTLLLGGVGICAIAVILIGAFLFIALLVSKHNRDNDIAAAAEQVAQLQRQKRAAEERADAERELARLLKDEIKTTWEKADVERTIADQLKKDIEESKAKAATEADKLKDDIRAAEQKAKTEQAIAEQLKRDIKAAEDRADADRKISDKLKREIEAAQEKATQEIESLKREVKDVVERAQAEKAVVDKLKKDIDAAKVAAAREKAPAGEWVDATKDAAIEGDIKVSVTSTVIDYVSGQYFGPTKSKEKVLIIRIKIENLSKSRKLDYVGWCSYSFSNYGKATLADNVGNKYLRLDFGIGGRIDGQVHRVSIYPETIQEDVLVFEVPVIVAEYLHLELPASALGGSGKLRLQLPRSMFAK